MAGLMDYLTSLIPSPAAPPGGYAPTENMFGGTRPLGLGAPVLAGPPRGGQGGNTGAPGVRPTPNASGPIMNSIVTQPPPVPPGAVGRLKGVGMPALAAPAATPIARDATGDATAVPAAAVPQGPGRQLSPGPNVIAPGEGMPPVAAPAPAMTGRQVTESLLANPHLPVSVRASLLGGLPRQPMPQEVAQQKLMQLYQDRHDNDIAQAMRLTDPNAQAKAKEDAYTRFEKYLRPLGIPGYGMIGIGQEDKAE